MKIFLKLIISYVVFVSAILIISCGAKKTEIKKYLKSSEIVKEESKTINENKETKENSFKKEEMVSFSEGIDLTADEIIIQESDKITIIKNPVLSKKKAENNKIFVEESNIATLEEKEVVIKSFEHINDVIKKTEKQKERKQFDWGLLLLQILPVVSVIYIIFIVWKWIKNKKPL